MPVRVFACVLAYVLASMFAVMRLASMPTGMPAGFFTRTIMDTAFRPATGLQGGAGCLPPLRQQGGGLITQAKPLPVTPMRGGSMYKPGRRRVILRQADRQRHGRYRFDHGAILCRAQGHARRIRHNRQPLP
jgi:hypothetical protein